MIAKPNWLPEPRALKLERRKRSVPLAGKSDEQLFEMAERAHREAARGAAILGPHSAQCVMVEISRRNLARQFREWLASRK